MADELSNPVKLTKYRGMTTVRVTPLKEIKYLVSTLRVMKIPVERGVFYILHITAQVVEDVPCVWFL